MTEPSNIRFYQVKTKERGHWTLTDLFSRPSLKKGQKEEDRPLSFMGKLFSGYLAFPNDTAEMSFVSNAPLQFASANADIAFKDCDAPIFSKFLEYLRREHKTALQEQAELMRFVRADLSLQDASTHAKGKLHNFVVQSLGEISYKLDSLFRAVVEDCRTRSKYTSEINSFEDLIRYKALTRADVEQWLAELSSHATVPDWAEIASDLSVSIVQKVRLRAEWMKYRAQALDVGDEAIRSVRREIRTVLQSFLESGFTLIELLDAVLPIVKPTAIKHLPIYSDDKLRVMILYEVVQDGKTGEFQSITQKSSD